MVAIELLAACQGLEFHRPKKTTAPLEEVYKLVRSVVKSWDKDRFMAPDIAAVTNLLQEGKVSTSTSLLLCLITFLDMGGCNAIYYCL